MPSEFDIIRQYFTLNEVRDDVVLGIGDDAAILSVPGNHQLVQSVDTLVAGVHFPTETSPEDIAYKALAVNLSDIAVMGAKPVAALVSLAGVLTTIMVTIILILRSRRLQRRINYFFS